MFLKRQIYIKIKKKNLLRDMMHIKNIKPHNTPLLYISESHILILLNLMNQHSLPSPRLVLRPNRSSFFASRDAPLTRLEAVFRLPGSVNEPARPGALDRAPSGPRAREGARPRAREPSSPRSLETSSPRALEALEPLGPSRLRGP